MAEIDDFDEEEEALQSSEAFQRFLGARSKSGHRIPLEEIEKEVSTDSPEGNSLELIPKLGSEDDEEGPNSVLGRHRGSLEICGDVVSPIDEDWDAER